MPEKQSLNGDVRQSESKAPSGAIDIPKAHAKTKHSSKGSPLVDGCDGKGEVFCLSSVESNPPPGKHKCNVELKTSLSMDPSGAAYVPKTNSNSSKRIKAASQAFRTEFFCKDRNFHKRMIKKGNTQNTNLVSVEISPKSTKEEFLNLNTVFVNGGSQSNRPINPIRIEHGSSTKKKQLWFHCQSLVWTLSIIIFLT